MFSALRGVADVDPRGRRHRPGRGLRPAAAVGRHPRRPPGSRSARGPAHRLVTRSLDLDLGTPLFTEAQLPADRDHLRAADAARRAAARRRRRPARRRATTRSTCRRRCHSSAARGAEVVTCEGGPSLNGDLVAADLIDEWDLTVSPLLVGGEAGRASRGPRPPTPAHAARPPARGRRIPADPVGARSLRSPVALGLGALGAG